MELEDILAHFPHEISAYVAVICLLVFFGLLTLGAVFYHSGQEQYVDNGIETLPDGTTIIRPTCADCASSERTLFLNRLGTMRISVCKRHERRSGRRKYFRRVVRERNLQLRVSEIVI